MAVKCRDVIKVMEELAPPYLAEQWDNPGLSVGDADQEVSRILVALDVISPVIEEAVSKKADMIVTHHPMIFGSMKSVTADTLLGRKVIELIAHHICTYSAHTNLDTAFGGTNDTLAELAGLKEIEILGKSYEEPLEKIVVYVPIEAKEAVRKAMCDAGAGFIGKYSDCTFQAEGKGTFMPREGANPYLGQVGALEEAREVRLETIAYRKDMPRVVQAMLSAHPYEEVAYDIYDVKQHGKTFGIGRIGYLEKAKSLEDFAVELKSLLDLSHITIVGEKNRMVKKVGICTGSGIEFMEEACQAGADVFITGDIKFHDAQRALDLGIGLIDATHYASEVLIVPVLQRYLASRLEGVEVMASQVNGQPFQILG